MCIAKLQIEVRRLQESLETKRHSRLEESDTILKDARSRLDSVRNAVCDHFNSVQLNHLKLLVTDRFVG